ncbi:Unconventional myosin-XIX [Holothuria leucospilota]|uniref:Unconventional myosin-XIX n=1 Tax=Holothuria leucospilota TaxID=206669 RepID=A0A9Q1CCL1_HOLLE|nr:Unconventional myosin-XIX [Holothuria leucospilota]
MDFWRYIDIYRIIPNPIIDLGLLGYAKKPVKKATSIQNDMKIETCPLSVQDLKNLRPLSDENVLQCLKARYEAGEVYSKAGITLIVVNPFRSVPELYNSRQVMRYHTGNSEELPPHIFAISDKAYSTMMLGLSVTNQSIIVSGESGAGKTWTTRCLMKYLTSLAEYNPSGFSPSPVHCIEKRILDSNPILEAFGNATTQRNNNSSRFGKYIKLQFDRSGFIIGASIQTYLLEKTRVVHQGQKERNFHIFYQMMESATLEERATWGLPPQGKGETSFAFLPNTGSMGEESSFISTREAMKSVGISEKQQEKIFKILSGILYLGNISFLEDDDTESCDIDESTHVQEALQMCCSLLGLKTEAFSNYMLTRRISASHGRRKSVFMKPCLGPEASSRRDCVAKLLYSRLFNWLVAFLNKHTSTNHSNAFIGLLDIYGFESFFSNSLEQLCINYANEKLQQHFVSHFLKAEQDEYKQEGLAWEFCNFTDNQPCLDVIEGRISIFSLLNEECKLNRPSDPKALQEKILSNVSRQCMSAKVKTSPQRAGFIVKHYAGDVEYGTVGLSEKNKDYIPPELTELLAASKNLFVRTLLRGDSLTQKKQTSDAGSTNTKVTVKTVISKFKNSLDDLMKTLRNTTPHYIRCIKPNYQCALDVFDSEFVANQLRACGVMETIAISRAGYPHKISFREFLGLYQVLLPNLQLPATEYCERIMENLFGLDDKENQLPGEKSQFKIGRTKMFLQETQLEQLHRKRNHLLNASATSIQRCWRKYRHEQYKKRRQWAAVVIQSVFRGWRCRLEIQKQNEAARVIQHAMLMYCIRKEQERLEADLETELMELEESAQSELDSSTEVACADLQMMTNINLTSLSQTGARLCLYAPVFTSVCVRNSSVESTSPKQTNLEDEIDGDEENEASDEKAENQRLLLEEDEEEDEGLEINSNSDSDESINESDIAINVTQEEQKAGAYVTSSSANLNFIKNRTTELALGAVVVGLLLKGPIKF